MNYYQIMWKLILKYLEWWKYNLFINEINFGYDSHEEEMQEIQLEIRRMRKELGLKDSKWF